MRKERDLHQELVKAAALGMEDKVLRQEVDINAGGIIDGTSLTAAASEVQMAMVLLLLDRGANIDGVGDGYGSNKTALAVAATRGQNATVSLLEGLISMQWVGNMGLHSVHRQRLQ